MRSQQSLNKVLSEILLESTLPEIFGIDVKNFSSKKNKEGIQILAGFLKEAAEGNIADPNDLPNWQETGAHILQKKH